MFLKTKSFINKDDDEDEDDEIDEEDNNKKIVEDVILDCRIAEKIKSDEKVLCLSLNVKELNDDETSAELIQAKKRKHKTVNFKEDEIIPDAVQKEKKPSKKFNKKRLKHDIRKAPLDAKLSKELYELEEDDGMDEYDDEDDSKNFNDKSSSDDDYSTDDYQEIDDTVEKPPRIKKIKLRKCNDCNTKHIPNECFIKKSINQLNDSIGLQQWREQNNVENILIKSEDVDDIDDNDDDDDESFSSDASLQDEDVSGKKSKPQNSITSFAEASIPAEFEIRKENDFSIFTKSVIPKYTKLGPLIGVVIPETDIIDDNNMKFIIETYNGTKSIFISIENKNNSNWMRFLRPAPTRELRNLTLVCIDGIVYFVTCSEIDVGCELLYWSDEINSAWDKKKIERTSKKISIFFFNFFQ